MSTWFLPDNYADQLHRRKHSCRQLDNWRGQTEHIEWRWQGRYCILQVGWVVWGNTFELRADQFRGVRVRMEEGSSISCTETSKPPPGRCWKHADRPDPQFRFGGNYQGSWHNWSGCRPPHWYPWEWSSLASCNRPPGWCHTRILHLYWVTGRKTRPWCLLEAGILGQGKGVMIVQTHTLHQIRRSWFSARICLPSRLPESGTHEWHQSQVWRCLQGGAPDLNWVRWQATLCKGRSSGHSTRRPKLPEQWLRGLIISAFLLDSNANVKLLIIL